jgi:hypothetical protein
MPDMHQLPPLAQSGRVSVYLCVSINDVAGRRGCNAVDYEARGAVVMVRATLGHCMLS